MATKEEDGDEGRITKEPERVVREKDPKKVAAGKKLAEYNRRAKKALQEKEASEKEASKKEAPNKEEKEEGSGGTWIPELDLTSILTMIGITLTLLTYTLSGKRVIPLRHRSPPLLPQALPLRLITLSCLPGPIQDPHLPSPIQAMG